MAVVAVSGNARVAPVSLGIKVLATAVSASLHATKYKATRPTRPTQSTQYRTPTNPSPASLSNLSFVHQAPSAGAQRELSAEPWFHGQVSRAAADSILQYDGDFFVRESMQSRGQYILSAMHKVPGTGVMGVCECVCVKGL